MKLLDHINGQTVRYALIGETLGHSLSPQIHHSLFQAMGMNAVYILLPVPRALVPETVKVLGASFAGFNVTIPYKEVVMPLLDEIQQTAAWCGAVNTVSCREKEGKPYLIGDNTDVGGFLKALESGSIMPTGRAAILGSGGTARTAAFSLASRGMDITLFARNPQAVSHIAEDVSKCYGKAVAVFDIKDARGGFDLMVNTTPVGMSPHSDASPVAVDVIADCGGVFDAVYNPLETRFLQDAKEAGIPAVSGIDMLFWQAVDAQRIWHGKLPEENVLAEILSALRESI